MRIGRSRAPGSPAVRASARRPRAARCRPRRDRGGPARTAKDEARRDDRPVSPRPSRCLACHVARVLDPLSRSTPHRPVRCGAGKSTATLVRPDDDPRVMATRYLRGMSGTAGRLADVRVRTFELRLIGAALVACWVVAAGARAASAIGRAARSISLVGLADAVPIAIALAGLRLAAGDAAAVARSRRWSGWASARCCSSSPRSSMSSTSSRHAAPRPSCRRSRRPIRGASRCSGRACSPASGSPGGCSASRRCGGGGSSRGVVVATSSRRRGRRSSPASRWPTSWRSATGRRRRRASARPIREDEPPPCDGPLAAGPHGPSRAPPRGRPSTAGRSARSTSPATAIGGDFRWLAYAATDAGAGPARRGADRRRDAWIRGARRRLAAGRPRSRSPTGRVDLQALETALTDGNRAAAEVHGVDVIEGARARHCRIAIDGPTFRSAFPQVELARRRRRHLDRWRGELDYWVFLDGQLGRVVGSVNGDAGAIRRGRPPGDDPGRPDRDRPRAATFRIDPPAR